MDNTEHNSWDEISNDVSEVKKKIKDKVVSENSIDDLKDSFQLTIENSKEILKNLIAAVDCLLYTSPSPRDATLSRMPSSA